MSEQSIYACSDPKASHWQLGPLPPDHGSMTLIGWSRRAESNDSGVPEDVTAILARALTSVARVTFLSSQAAVGKPSGAANQIVPLVFSGIGRVSARFHGLPPNAALLSTRDAQIAMQLFDDSGFPWWLQGQVALLSAPDAPPPDVDGQAVLSLFDENWTNQSAALASRAVSAVLRPGVDGDLAGLLSLNEEFEQRALAALEREARSADFGWFQVPEAQFVS